MELTPEPLAGLCADAEALCRLVAPLDLAGHGVYVLASSQVPVELGGGIVCGGATHRRMDLYLRGVIGERWVGRGFACVVNDTDTAADPADVRRGRFLAVALHELSHGLTSCFLARKDPEPSDPAAVQAEARQVAAVLADPEKLAPPGWAPWRYHEWTFLRCAAHLWRRADRAGVPLLSEEIVPPVYGYGHPFYYFRMLMPEADRMASVSLREILATPAPQPFVETLAADTANWSSIDHRQWAAGPGGSSAGCRS